MARSAIIRRDSLCGYGRVARHGFNMERYGFNHPRPMPYAACY